MKLHLDILLSSNNFATWKGTDFLEICFEYAAPRIPEARAIIRAMREKYSAAAH